MEWSIAILGIYALLGIGIYTPWLANQMMFHPPQSTYQLDEHFLKLKTSLNDEITAFHKVNPTASHTLIYAHGNAEDIEYVKWLAEELYQLGLSILIFEYPGYGYSTGKPSEQGAYAAAQAAYDFLVQQKILPTHIIAYGRSIGGGVATELALKNPVAGLILESTFVNAPQVVTKLPFYPFPPFNNLKKLPQIKVPTLIIHGTHDKLISHWHGKKLFEAANAPKMHFWAEGANHNNVFETDHHGYQQAVLNFLERIKRQK